MSRPIKFRAWDKAYGAMCYASDGAEHLSGWLRAPEIFTVMQYTGLKDKNGVEIFEGDIIRETDGDAYEVRYMADRDYPAFDTVPEVGCDENGLSFLVLGPGCEVVGNIYENPDLLN